jgi:hypothetical protein
MCIGALCGGSTACLPFIRTGAGGTKKERNKERRKRNALPTSEIESSRKSTATARHRTFENSVVPSPARACGLCRGGGNVLLFDLEDGRKPHGAPAHCLCWRHGRAGRLGARAGGAWLVLHLCCAEGAGRGGGQRPGRGVGGYEDSWGVYGWV